MRREEFLKELEELLRDLPELERREALQYYTDYFEDAGREEEAAVIEELGSPKLVAQKIKEGLRTEKKLGETSLNQQNNKFLKLILLVVAGLCVFPVLGSLLASVIGVILSLFGILIGLVVAGVCLCLVGVALVGVGIAYLMQDGVFALALMGVGLMITAFGGVSTIGSIWLNIKAFAATGKGMRWVKSKIPSFKKGVR